MRILGLALAIVGSLLATTAGAQTSCAPDGRPIDPYYENDTFAEWPQEAQRFKNNAELVSRQRDRLRLALDGGKSIELVDCPYGDDGYHFLYERYDQAGRFYVVRKSAHDDFSYMLVMMPTGRLFTVYGAPVWASEKSKFLTIGCSLQPPRGALVIHAPAGEGWRRRPNSSCPAMPKAARRAGTTSRGSRSPACRATAAARRARSSC